MIGAIVGDIVGSRFEFANYRNKDFDLFSTESTFTDDTVMTMAVASILINNEINNKDKIVKTLKSFGLSYPKRGYGGAFMHWLLSKDTEAYYSFGNGAAMRISSIGLLANNEEQVRIWSKKITEVTHNHPEGIKGAEIAAMCIYYAKIGKSKGFIKKYVSNFYNIDFKYKNLKETYCFNETCQETVPQAIYCFLISNSFEDCLRTSISIGGDSDTLACISCGIAEAYYKKINNNIIEEVKKIIPNNFLNILKKEYSMIDEKNSRKFNSIIKLL